MKTRKEPIAKVSKEMADAFGMHGMPNVEVQPQPTHTTEGSHTPTPWNVQPHIFQGEERVRIRHDSDGLASYIAELCNEVGICNEHGGTPQANATFIVRAVNSHEEMLRELKSAHASELQFRNGISMVQHRQEFPKECSACEAIAKAEGK